MRDRCLEDETARLQFRRNFVALAVLVRASRDVAGQPNQECAGGQRKQGKIGSENEWVQRIAKRVDPFEVGEAGTAETTGSAQRARARFDLTKPANAFRPLSGERRAVCAMQRR